MQVSKLESIVIGIHIIIVLFFIIAVFPVVAEDASEDEDKSKKIGKITYEELTILGTRSKPRSILDSLVPIDILNARDFSAIGGTADITDNLNTLLPSYLATPATGDGSAFVRPTTLRGMASDQILILLNGKRRHRSALIQLFAPAANNGSHGVDIAMIPSIALKNVEILRDGASAQYGSDAIAGVINLELKDASKGGLIETSYGRHYEGEASWRVAANTGLSLGADRGFINLSIDSNDAEALSRGRQRPDAQALIDQGIQGVGIDAVFDDAPLVQTWGRPETSGTRFLINSGFDLSDDVELYFFGNYAQTKGRFRFFYRPPDHSFLSGTLAKDPSNLEREKETGFTPYLDGEQDDMSTIFGLRGRFLNSGTNYDFSVATGSNKLDYTLYNSLNPNAPLIDGRAQRNFDTGDYTQQEFNVNMDFSTELSNEFNLGYGLEYRREAFTQYVGEFAAYTGVGVSGLAGTRPSDAGKHRRRNYAVYADLEHEVSDDLLLQYASRYENFSDFGGTINGKLAFRYSFIPSFALRGSISTGFHAPTPGQANLRTTTTTFSATRQINIKHVPADSPEAAALGGTQLEEEKSVNMSVGFVSEISKNTTLTLDLYHITVDGRIYRTSINEEISFYTNALDTKHRGLDLVWTSNLIDLIKIDTSVSLAYNYNSVDIFGNRRINSNKVVSDDLVEDIENNYPKHKFILTGNTRFMNKWNLMTRARYIGSHYDERGNISGTSAHGQSQKVDPVVYIDIELGYQLMKGLNLFLGGANIFDKYPDVIEDAPGVANGIYAGLPYARRTAANYEGGLWYFKLAYTF